MTTTKFCERCGAFLQVTGEGLTCPRCGFVSKTEVIEVRRNDRSTAEPVYVVEGPGEDDPTVSQTCPRCGYTEAYRMVLTTQGEHAGVKQDRAVERYRCAGCGHTWVRN